MQKKNILFYTIWAVVCLNEKKCHYIKKSIHVMKCYLRGLCKKKLTFIHSVHFMKCIKMIIDNMFLKSSVNGTTSVHFTERVISLKGCEYTKRVYMAYKALLIKTEYLFEQINNLKILFKYNIRYRIMR